MVWGLPVTGHCESQWVPVSSVTLGWPWLVSVEEEEGCCAGWESSVCSTGCS